MSSVAGAGERNDGNLHPVSPAPPPPPGGRTPAACASCRPCAAVDQDPVTLVPPGVPRGEGGCVHCQRQATDPEGRRADDRPICAEAVHPAEGDGSDLRARAQVHASIRDGGHGAYGARPSQEGRPHAQDAARGDTRRADEAAAALEGLDNQGQIVVEYQGGIRVHRGGEGEHREGVRRSHRRAVDGDHGAAAQPPP